MMVAVTTAAMPAARTEPEDQPARALAFGPELALGVTAVGVMGALRLGAAHEWPDAAIELGASIEAASASSLDPFSHGESTTGRAAIADLRLTWGRWLLAVGFGHATADPPRLPATSGPVFTGTIGLYSRWAGALVALRGGYARGSIDEPDDDVVDGTTTDMPSGGVWLVVAFGGRFRLALGESTANP